MLCLKTHKENGGIPVPSLAFQHIIIPEIWDVLLKTGEADDNGNIISVTDDYVKEYSVVKKNTVC